ncbi:MAG: hypothetical protein ACI8R0_002405, partial [Alteromonadales bacterium]
WLHLPCPQALQASSPLSHDNELKGYLEMTGETLVAA